MPKYEKRDYHSVEDCFKNGLRIRVMECDDPDFYSVHLIRTDDATQYTKCLIKLTTTAQWRQLRAILEQLKSERKNAKYYSQSFGNKAYARVDSVPHNTSNKGYLTTISLCCMRQPTADDKSNLPHFRPKPQKKATKSEPAKKRKRGGKDIDDQLDPDDGNDDTNSAAEEPTTSSKPSYYTTYKKDDWFHDVSCITLEDQHLDFVLENATLSQL